MGALETHLDAQKRARAIYAYVVPESIPGEIKTVELTELTAEEELQAIRRANDNAMKAGYEALKQALVSVNGNRVTVADGSADLAFDSMHPKLRNLLMAEYADLTHPSEENMKDFRGSRTVKVG